MSLKNLTTENSTTIHASVARFDSLIIKDGITITAPTQSLLKIVDSTIAPIPIGTNGKVLTVTAGVPTWESVPPTELLGDGVVLNTTAGGLEVLANGAEDLVLTMRTGTPQWRGVPASGPQYPINTVYVSPSFVSDGVSLFSSIATAITYLITNNISGTVIINAGTYSADILITTNCKFNLIGVSSESVTMTGTINVNTTTTGNEFLHITGISFSGIGKMVTITTTNKPSGLFSSKFTDCTIGNPDELVSTFTYAHFGRAGLDKTTMNRCVFSLNALTLRSTDFSIQECTYYIVGNCILNDSNDASLMSIRDCRFNLGGTMDWHIQGGNVNIFGIRDTTIQGGLSIFNPLGLVGPDPQALLFGVRVSGVLLLNNLSIIQATMCNIKTLRCNNSSGIACESCIIKEYNHQTNGNVSIVPTRPADFLPNLATGTLNMSTSFNVIFTNSIVITFAGLGLPKYPNNQYIIYAIDVASGGGAARAFAITDRLATGFTITASNNTATTCRVYILAVLPAPPPS